MFGGHFSSLDHAKAEFNLERHFFNKTIKMENKLRDNLKSDGLTDAQIEGIVNEGKFVKFVSEKQKKDMAPIVGDDMDYVG